MRRIDNPEQPYPFNEQQFPYIPMTAREAEECYYFAAYMGEEYLIDAFEELLAKSANIDDVAWTISGASVGERYSDHPDNDLLITSEKHPVDVFTYGVCFGLWASCPDMSQDGSVYVSNEMSASITAIETKDSQRGLFKYSQTCLDYVYDNDPAYFYLAANISDNLYNQQTSVPFLYGAAAGRMLFMFRQADIEEIDMAWEQHNQKFLPSKTSEPWLN